MLGQSISRVARRSDDWLALDAAPLPWSSADQLERIASQQFDALRELATSIDGGWSVIWAAGASSVASTEEDTKVEAEQFRMIFRMLAESIGSDSRGSIFFASSVGAIYAGSESPPFTELSPAAATSPYGRLKLEMEEVVAGFSSTTGVPSVIGRITNLYGPGQRLDKAQGLISHLLLSRFTKTPVSIFVPLETVRDYVFVDDCAHLILDCLLELELESPRTTEGRTVTKILGSGQGVSISSLLTYLRFIAKSSPAVSIGERPSAKFQAADLRVRSIVWPHLDRREHTPIAAGFHATMIDILRALQR